jgi:hypothetical protein
MPVFPVKLAYNHEYFIMIDPAIPFANNLVFDPPTLQFPGDVEAIGDKINIPGTGALQTGKLINPVKVTFTRFDVDRVFPVNSRVIIWYNADDTPKDIFLDTDHLGGPVVEAAAPVAPMGGGRRRRRSIRRRNTRRHRRNTRRSHRSRRH